MSQTVDKIADSNLGAWNGKPVGCGSIWESVASFIVLHQPITKK
jgi:hypothetical protein